jgi:hypothetical protein
LKQHQTQTLPCPRLIAKHQKNVFWSKSTIKWSQILNSSNFSLHGHAWFKTFSTRCNKDQRP